jgi:hypothetical protein
MATSPTSQSALKSGAAKDDALGQDGDFTFNIADLLANDPGGAAKVDVNKQFFFGDTAADQADQAGYMASHGIIKNLDGTFTFTDEAIDFNYFVQIGNKGTWSVAHVDVTAPPAPPAPEPEPHLGDTLFSEYFDHAPIQTFWSNGKETSATINLVSEGWTGTGHNDQFGFTDVSEVGMDGVLGGIKAASGQFFLDTQNTPGGIDISRTFTDSTDAVGGTTSVLSFDIGKMAVNWDGVDFATASDAMFEFRIDGQTVKQFDASDFANFNKMEHFDIDIGAYANAGSEHTLELVDTSATDGYFGFAVDSIQIHDWVIC